MEKLILNLQSQNQIIAYRDENRLTGYEPGILNEILAAAQQRDIKLLNWFNQFGDSFRSILMNVYAYRKGLEFGFTDIAFDQYGWFKRPVFVETESLIFGNEAKYGEHSTLSIGKGVAQVWTNALSYRFGTAGGGCGLSVYGKQFQHREAAINSGIAELKAMMTEKLNHSDTSNYKQPIIQSTLNAIEKYQIKKVQLSLF